MEKLKNFLKKRIGFLKLFIFIALVFKTMIFIALSSTDTGRSFTGTWGVYIDYRTVLGQLSFIFILMVPAYFFKGKKQISYLIFIDILYTLLLLADMWYYRGNKGLLGVRHILFKDMFNPFSDNLINPSIIDILFIFDIPIIIFIRYKYKELLNYKRKIVFGVLGILGCVGTIYGTYYLFDVKNIDNGKVMFMRGEWAPFVTVQRATPLGYHLYEANLALEKKDKTSNEEQMKEVDAWLNWNKEDLPKNEYAGILKGKNVVFLQIESLENFVIGKKVYGQEITPNLNKLIKKSLYFDNFYEQNNGGNSIDCDMMVNAGLLTLGDSITFLSHPEVKYPSMARELNKIGYETASTHAERGSDWNWSEAHANSLDFKKMWDIGSYDVNEVVGFGLSDRTFYNQYVNKLTTLKEPFFSMIPTLSSHMPFNISDSERKLKLPKNVDNSYIGGYIQSIHYADAQIGYFMKRLEEAGLKEDTVVAIYGDHTGVHKYYSNEIKDVPLEGDFWQKGDNKIPLIITGPGLKGEKIDTFGGHSDIMPTMLYLLGVYNHDSVMGRNLLNTNRNAVVLKGGKVVGNPTKEEKEKLSESYKIADYLIKNNYYQNRGLID
ncbi:LTA synthase family protein [Clostridium chrysemydis]|uniref:LTA synthase family protein n=1 Tax=Clostridium chrysemydis TaxID=2665504 RepID=UPI001883EF21|nr:LTA synthase family protein [Clostridium chrysemydis]